MFSASSEGNHPEAVLQSTNLLQRVVRGYLTRKKLLEAKALYKTILEELEDDQLQLTWKHCSNFCWPKAFIKLRTNKNTCSVPKSHPVTSTQSPYPTNPSVIGAGDIDDLLNELSDLIVPTSAPVKSVPTKSTPVASALIKSTPITSTPAKLTSYRSFDTDALAASQTKIQTSPRCRVDVSSVQSPRVITKHSISQPILSNQSEHHTDRSRSSAGLNCSVKSSGSSPLGPTHLNQTSKIPIKHKSADKTIPSGNYSSGKRSAGVRPNRRPYQNQNLSQSRANVWVPPGVPARAVDGTIQFLDGKSSDRELVTTRSSTSSPSPSNPPCRKHGAGVNGSERSRIPIICCRYCHKQSNAPTNLHDWPKVGVNKFTNISRSDKLCKVSSEVVVRADKETSPTNYNTDRSPAKTDPVTLYKETSVQTEFLDFERQRVSGSSCVTPPASQQQGGSTAKHKHEDAKGLLDMSLGPRGPLTVVSAPVSETLSLHSTNLESPTHLIKTETEGTIFSYGTQTDMLSGHLLPPDSICESTVLSSKVTPPPSPAPTVTRPTADPDMSVIPTDPSQVPDASCQPLDLRMSPSRQQPPAKSVTTQSHSSSFQQTKPLHIVQEPQRLPKQLQSQPSPVKDDRLYTPIQMSDIAADDTISALVEPPSGRLSTEESAFGAAQPVAVLAEDDKAVGSFDLDMSDSRDSLTVSEITVRQSSKTTELISKPPVTPEQTPSKTSSVNVTPSKPSDTRSHGTRDLTQSNVIQSSITETSACSPIAEGDNTSIWNETVSEVAAHTNHGSAVNGVANSAHEELSSLQDSLSLELMWIEQAISSRKQYLSLKDEMNN